MTLFFLIIWACAEDEPALTIPPSGGEVMRAESLPLGGVSSTPDQQGGSSAGVAAQGGEVGPQGGQAAPQGGQAAPQGGEVSPQGGEVGPQGGEVGPQGGEVDPQGGELGPEGGGVEGGAQGGGVSGPFNPEAPCEGLRDEMSTSQRCGRFIGCVYTVCPERQLSEELLRPLCLDTLEPEDTGTFCSFNCTELVEISGVCEEAPPTTAEFCSGLSNPSDPEQACQAMSACLLTQCPVVEPQLPRLCEEWAGEICAQSASCEELAGALCPQP